MPCILARVESLPENMARVQITLKHLQDEMHEGFQLWRTEMETGREQTSQEISLLSRQISQILELRTSPNVEIQRPPSPYPSLENGGVDGSSFTPALEFFLSLRFV